MIRKKMFNYFARSTNPLCIVKIMNYLVSIIYCME